MASITQEQAKTLCDWKPLQAYDACQMHNSQHYHIYRQARGGLQNHTPCRQTCKCVRSKNKQGKLQAVAMQSQMKVPQGSHRSPKGMEVSAQVQSPLPLAV